MLKITATNLYGQSLQVTQNSLFRLTVAGLNPPAAVVYTADLATKNGSLYNGSKVQNRYITLTAWPAGRSPENARLELYKVFKVSKFVRLQITNGTRSCYIDGYVEDMPGESDTPTQSLQIPIVCPDPFLTAAAETTASVPTSGTAVTVNNGGDFETGAEFTITATGACSGITITNSTTGQSFGVNVTLAAGDKLTLTTYQGGKSLMLKRSGADPTNILNLMTAGSVWPILQPGNNSVQFAATSGGANAAMTVKFSALYGGI